MKKQTVSRRLAMLLATVVLLMNGCTAVESSDLTMFLRDFVLQATAAFLF